MATLTEQRELVLSERELFRMTRVSGLVPVSPTQLQKEGLNVKISPPLGDAPGRITLDTHTARILVNLGNRFYRGDGVIHVIGQSQDGQREKMRINESELGTPEKYFSDDPLKLTS